MTLTKDDACPGVDRLEQAQTVSPCVSALAQVELRRQLKVLAEVRQRVDGARKQDDADLAREQREHERLRRDKQRAQTELKRLHSEIHRAEQDRNRLREETRTARGQALVELADLRRQIEQRQQELAARQSRDWSVLWDQWKPKAAEEKDKAGQVVVDAKKMRLQGQTRGQPPVERWRFQIRIILLNPGLFDNKFSMADPRQLHRLDRAKYMPGPGPLLGRLRRRVVSRADQRRGGAPFCQDVSVETPAALEPRVHLRSRTHDANQCADARRAPH